METKICKDCKHEFPKTDEYFYRNGKYYRSYCKNCININIKNYRQQHQDHFKETQRHWQSENKQHIRQNQKRWREENRERSNESAYKYRLKKYYNLTMDDYKQKLSEQDYKCAICGKLADGKFLAVDHDHKTGEIRGLLCDNCNVGIGNLQDNIDILENAISYLKKYKNGE